MSILKRYCGCDSTGNRCEEEGTLWARLEAAIEAADAAGIDRFALNQSIHLPEGRALAAARQAYHAHFQGGWKIIRAKKKSAPVTDMFAGIRHWDNVNN